MECRRRRARHRRPPGTSPNKVLSATMTGGFPAACMSISGCINAVEDELMWKQVAWYGVKAKKEEKRGRKKEEKIEKCQTKRLNLPPSPPCLYLPFFALLPKETDPTIIFCPPLPLSSSLPFPCPRIDPVLYIETAVETRRRSAGAQQKVAFGGFSRHALHCERAAEPASPPLLCAAASSSEVTEKTGMDVLEPHIKKTGGRGRRRGK